MQINHKLYRLNNVLNYHFNGKDHKQIMHMSLHDDITDQVDDLVQYIKLNY